MFVRLAEGKIENPVEAFNKGEWFFNFHFSEFGDYYFVHALREPEEGEAEEDSGLVIQ